MKKMSAEVAEQALALEFFCADLDRQLTIKQYLMGLLSTLWDEGESFSGKRPFGNSGWQYDLYAPLINSGYIKGTLDEDNCVNEVDSGVAHKFVADLIQHLAC